MKVYYPNTLKIVKDFNRTENALRTRVWTLDANNHTLYGYSRVPMAFIKNPHGSLEKTAYDYKFKNEILTAASGQQWELHFDNDSERYKWELYHFAFKINIPQYVQFKSIKHPEISYLNVQES